MENNYYVYVFTNPQKSRTMWYKGFQFTQEPFYIGISKNKNRKNVHFQPSKLNDGSIKSRTIQKIIEKGLKVGQIILYDHLTFKEACEIEIDFIKYFGRRKDKTGVLTNITEGGEGNIGLIHSEEVLKLLRKPLFQFDENFKLTNKFNSVKSALQLNKELSKTGLQNAYNEKYLYRGYYWSLTKDVNQVEFFKKDDRKSKPRYSFSIYKDGELIKEFDSIHEVENNFDFKVSRGNISYACSGKLKTYLGYEWKKIKK